jgi:hypothetical protein
MSFFGFLRRFVLWSAAFVALLCLLWVGICCEERWRGKRAWNDYRAAAIARGVELDLADLRRKPIPDEENFAAAPMIRDLFTGSSGGASTRRWFQALKLEVQPPSQGGRKGKGPDLVYWRDHFVRQRVITAGTDNPAEDVLRALELVQPELDALREAGKRPKSRFPIQWERGMEATLPHAVPLLRAAQVHELAIAARLSQGDSAGAYVSAREMLRLYEALREEPTVFAGQWRVGLLTRLNAVVRDGLLANHWVEPELQLLSDDFARIDLLSDWRFTVSSERVYVNTNFDLLEQKRAAEVARQPFGIHSVTWCATPPADYVIIATYPRGWLSLSKVKINEYFDRQIARVDAMQSGVTPATEGELVDDLGTLEKDGGVFSRILYFLAIASRPPLPSIRAEYLKAASDIEITRIACSLTLYQQRNGLFPDSLTKLVPEYLSEIPRDLMDGAPLRYRRTKSGYDIWSIGRNLKDDGGALVPAKVSREQPDWVLHFARADDDQ